MRKVYILLFPQILIVVFLCIAQKTLCHTNNNRNNFCNKQDINNIADYDFKIGDTIVFKKNEQGFLFEGIITEIYPNTAIAIVNYINPDEPAKSKDFEVGLDRLKKVKKVANKNDLELNMPIIFKKVNSERLFEGIITSISQTSAIIEYSDPAEPLKVKECESEFGRMYKVSKPAQSEVKNEVEIENVPETKNEFNIGDKVSFILNSMKMPLVGVIIATNKNTATVEYIDPIKRFKKSQKEIEYSMLKLKKKK